MKINLEILQSAFTFATDQIEDLKTKELVPDMIMRRRFTRSAKIFAYLANEVDFSNGRIFYGSSFGELSASASILNAILNQEPISPTDFQNSVYNTAASYFSILKGNRNEIVTVSSGENTSLKLLELAAIKGLENEEILLIAIEALNIPNIQEVNQCIDFLESGVALKVKVTQEQANVIAEKFEASKGYSNSIQHMLVIAQNQNLKRIVEINF